MRTNFAGAISAIRQGYKMTREGWHGKNACVMLHPSTHPDELPYVMMRTSEGKYVPWTASQTDMLSDDWMLAK